MLFTGSDVVFFNVFNGEKELLLANKAKFGIFYCAVCIEEWS